MTSDKMLLPTRSRRLSSAARDGFFVVCTVFSTFLTAAFAGAWVFVGGRARPSTPVNVSCRS